MKIPLANSDDSQKSLEKLNDFYKNDFIPGEKKPYLTNLKKSMGPYLAVESSRKGDVSYILDGGLSDSHFGIGFFSLSLYGCRALLGVLDQSR